MIKIVDGVPVAMSEDELAEITVMQQPTLADRQRSMCKDVDVLRSEKLQSFTYDFGVHGIKTLQLRNGADRTNWLTLDSTCEKLIRQGVGYMMVDLRTGDNTTVTITADEASQALLAMAQYGSAVMKRGWELKDQINNSTNPEIEVDIQTGWPS